MLRTGHLSNGEAAVGPDVLLDGFGLERTVGGRLYSGQFRAGKWHGRGVLSGSDSHGNYVTFDGLWDNGIREGRGVETVRRTVTAQARPIAFCVGVWENGSKHGAFRCLLDGSKHGSIVKRRRPKLLEVPCACARRAQSLSRLGPGSAALRPV